MTRPKISVIGAGNVGATVAQILALKEMGDVYLFDVVDGIPEGKALDILEGGPHWKSDSNVLGFTTVDKGNYKNLEGSDVIVITAGLARKPGMSRDDLLQKNVEIMTDVGKNIKKYAPDAKLVVVTNPADIIAYSYGYSNENILHSVMLCMASS